MKLAIFTGTPLFEKPLYVGNPMMEEETKRKFFKYMDDVFTRNYFTNNGPMVQRLEEEIAKIHSVKHCVAVCNATIGEILVLKALELKGEIILPSFTFISTAHSCLWQGAKTVFCDISADSLTIDANSAVKLISADTSAIIGVHLFGNTCDVKALELLCKDKNIKLIFDAAHAFNCSYGKTPVGNFGNAEILSFHATKFFSTFEGGAILTNDSQLDAALRILRNFGFRNYDDVGFLGINAKMSEASAAIGLASLDSINLRLVRLKETYEMYREELHSIPGIKLLSMGDRGKTNYHYIPILINQDKFGLPRDLLYQVLWKENIIARRYFYPGCHRMEPYKTIYPDAYKKLPVTESIVQRILCLPSNLQNPKKDIPAIVEVIKSVQEHKDKVLAWAKIRS